MRTLSIGGKKFEEDNSALTKLKDMEIEERFRKAMERSKETYSMLESRGPKTTVSSWQNR